MYNMYYIPFFFFFFFIQIPSIEPLIIEHLGVCSVASSLCVLDNGYVFIGSALASSQLIRIIVSEGNIEESGNNNIETRNSQYSIQIIGSYNSLGPIVDMCLQEDKIPKLITCSGTLGNGSLGVFRIGTEIITEVDNFALPPIIRMFSIYNCKGDVYGIVYVIGGSDIVSNTKDVLKTIKISNFIYSKKNNVDDIDIVKRDKFNVFHSDIETLWSSSLGWDIDESAETVPWIQITPIGIFIEDIVNTTRDINNNIKKNIDTTMSIETSINKPEFLSDDIFMQIHKKKDINIESNIIIATGYKEYIVLEIMSKNIWYLVQIQQIQINEKIVLYILGYEVLDNQISSLCIFPTSPTALMFANIKRRIPEMVLLIGIAYWDTDCIEVKQIHLNDKQSIFDKNKNYSISLKECLQSIIPTNLSSNCNNELITIRSMVGVNFTGVYDGTEDDNDEDKDEDNVLDEISCICTQLAGSSNGYCFNITLGQINNTLIVSPSTGKRQGKLPINFTVLPTLQIPPIDEKLKYSVIGIQILLCGEIPMILTNDSIIHRKEIGIKKLQYNQSIYTIKKMLIQYKKDDINENKILIPSSLRYKPQQYESIEYAASFHIHNILPYYIFIYDNKNGKLITISSPNRSKFTLYPLYGEQPLKIACIKENKQIAVATVRQLQDDNEIIPSSSVIVYDTIEQQIDQDTPIKNFIDTISQRTKPIKESFQRIYNSDTFDMISSLRLSTFEEPTSLCVYSIPNIIQDGETCLFTESFQDINYKKKQNNIKTIDIFILGTSFIHSNEAISTLGNIYMLQYINKKIKIIGKRTVYGGVVAIKQYRNSQLIGINSTIIMYYIHKNITPIDDMIYTLIPGPSHTGHEMIISIDTDNNIIAIGTISQFISLLLYRPSRESLELIARDIERRWCTSVNISSQNIILSSDDTGSIYALSRFKRFFCETLDVLLHKGIILGDICKDIDIQLLNDDNDDDSSDNKYIEILKKKYEKKIQDDIEDIDTITLKQQTFEEKEINVNRTDILFRNRALYPIAMTNIGDIINCMVSGTLQKDIFTYYNLSHILCNTITSAGNNNKFNKNLIQSSAFTMDNIELLIKITSQSMNLQIYEASEMLTLPIQDILFGTISGSIGTIGQLTIYQFIFINILHDAITAAAAAESLNMENPVIDGIIYDPTSAVSVQLFSNYLSSASYKIII